MGCSETKNMPSLLFVFEPQNDQQKNYCIKLKDSLQPERSIQFEVKSFKNSNFSIKLKKGGKEYDIENNFDENQMQSSIDKIYLLLGETNSNK
jgi:hypothetical protein